MFVIKQIRYKDKTWPFSTFLPVPYLKYYSNLWKQQKVSMWPGLLYNNEYSLWSIMMEM